MGMYSYHQYEDIYTDYPEEMMEWKAKRIGDEPDDYWDAVYINEKTKEVSLGDMNGWKIIGYWYPNFLKFLSELALFVEGEVCFLYETLEDMAIIHFAKGTYIIDMGEMHFTKFSQKDMNEIHGVPIKHPKELIDLLMIGRL